MQTLRNNKNLLTHFKFFTLFLSNLVHKLPQIQFFDKKKRADFFLRRAMNLSGSRFAKTFLSYRLCRSLHVISQFVPPSYPGKEDLYVATQADITRRYFEASGEQAELKLFSIDGVSESFLDHLNKLSIEGIFEEPSVNLEKVVR